MRLTAELALNQVKGNRKRTVGTVVATALSTALLTSVMCFVTSGYRMLQNFLGTDFGEYVGAYLLMLFIPALFLGLLIAIMSVTVIANIYESSATKRLGEFGVLKCIGATRKQIRETVVFESLWISLFAIPIGLICGTLIGFIGVAVTGRYIDYFNELSKSIVMRPFSFELGFHVSPFTYIFAVIFSMMVVLASTAKPARKSGKITAIECIKGRPAGDINATNNHDGLFMEKIFGYEGLLGSTNVARNKTAYRSTVRALALSIMLILVAGSFKNQAQNAMKWMSSIGNDMLVDYVSIMEEAENNLTGKPQSIIVAPISYATAEEITGKLKAYEKDFEVLGVGSDRTSYCSFPDENVMSSELLKAPGVIGEYNEIATELLTVDEKNYELICQKAGVPVGSNILINYYAYNDNGKMKELEPFSDNISSLQLVDSSNNIKEIAISGTLRMEQLPGNAFNALSLDPIRIIIPEGDMRFFTWYSNPKDDASFTQYAREIMNEYFPILSEDSYVEQGYSVRISRADQMIKVMNITIILGEILLTGLIVLLMVMGFASVISTLSANIRIRQREFAVLKSIGMTGSSLEKMVYSESALCSIKACIRGVIAGIALPYFINLSVRKVFPVRYELPVLSLVLGIALVFVLLILITKIEISKMRDQDIAYDIRKNVT